MNGKLTRQTDISFLRALFKSLGKTLREIGFSSPLYNQRLKGKHPLKLMLSPNDPFVGNSSIGADVIEDKLNFSGHILEKTGEGVWEKMGPAPSGFITQMQCFKWLAHLATLADKKRATKRAEDLTRLWLNKNYNWSLPAWRPEFIGRRIINWALHAPLILSSSDMVYRSKVLNSLARQSRHLFNSYDLSPRGLPRIEALTGLALSSILMPDGDKRLQRGLKNLKNELGLFILADGGAITRNVTDSIEVLNLLIYLRTFLIDDNRECPDWVQTTADKIVPFIRCLQHNNQSLASFEGAFSDNISNLNETINLSGAKGGAIENASLSGFIRGEAQNTLFIFDVGPPAKPSFSKNSHAGCLSFELSDGKDLIVTNMGGTNEGYGGDNANLNHYARHTGAHSTLCYKGENIVSISENGFLKNNIFYTKFKKNKNEDGIWINASHNGYQKTFGAIHTRALFLNKEGTDFRGEDELKIYPRKFLGFLGWGNEKNINLHFILHPKVSASLTQDGKAIIIRLAHGHGWVFRATGGEVKLEDALHSEKPSVRSKTLRIVVETSVSESNYSKINWQFKKVKDQISK
ncbi:MAG: heparinase II/III family protein [Sphingomonadales bacterium]|jgi:uncharacterized heparinase superfamily protein